MMHQACTLFDSAAYFDNELDTLDTQRWSFGDLKMMENNTF